jgi:hypothetical protein
MSARLTSFTPTIATDQLRRPDRVLTGTAQIQWHPAMDLSAVEPGCLAGRDWSARVSGREDGLDACSECGSSAVSERPESHGSGQGYLRFRCRACGKQFDDVTTCRPAAKLAGVTDLDGPVVSTARRWHWQRLQPGQAFGFANRGQATTHRILCPNSVTGAVASGSLLVRNYPILSRGVPCTARPRKLRATGDRASNADSAHVARRGLPSRTWDESHSTRWTPMRSPGGRAGDTVR